METQRFALRMSKKMLPGCPGMSLEGIRYARYVQEEVKVYLKKGRV
jgi:hypothetical protein